MCRLKSLDHLQIFYHFQFLSFSRYYLYISYLNPRCYLLKINIKYNSKRKEESKNCENKTWYNQIVNTDGDGERRNILVNIFIRINAYDVHYKLIKRQTMLRYTKMIDNTFDLSLA